MRAKLKQVVDGKVYDTETAQVVASDEYWDGHNFERRGTNTHLQNEEGSLLPRPLDPVAR